jgi:hypothetical protein
LQTGSYVKLVCNSSLHVGNRVQITWLKEVGTTWQKRNMKNLILKIGKKLAIHMEFSVGAL